MVKVFILTLNRKIENGLKKMFQSYIYDNMIALEVRVFRDPKMLLKTDLSGAILFIDDNENSSAVKTAQFLRESDFTGPIVIITDNIECVYDAFKVDAYRVIQLPVAQSDIYEVLDSYRKQKLSGRIIIFKDGPKRLTIPTKDIIYVTTIGHDAQIITKTGVVSTTVPLFQITTQLPNHYFFCCHRSFVINFINVRSVTKGITNVLMSNGDVIPISRRKKTEFMEAREAFLESSVFTII